jgi:site-specific DNA recombinase
VGQRRQFTNPAEPPAKRAVLYLRVSSAGQVNTDYDPEGISIPAQRRRCVEKARELGVEIIDEYVEPGKSATAISKRPVFQAMMSRIKNQRDVNYVIVYSTSRMNRNWMENGAVLLELRKLDVSMISATENIDDSPLGEAMTGFLAVFNGFQSAANGQDIRYKMGQKARAGGTVSMAPIGYLNTVETFEGRKVRSVAIDPERSPLVKLAFELYATGRLSQSDLRETLKDTGLRSRPTTKNPNGTPLSIHTIGKMLQDRYYLGVVAHDGEEYPGRHEALIDSDLFDQVQHVLFKERGAGTRSRIHHHYLKGLLWCGRCGKRIILWPGRSKNGSKYFYFVCIGRQDKSCDLPYMRTEAVETCVLDHYATVPIPDELRHRIRERIDQAATASKSTADKFMQTAKAQLEELDKKEDQYLDLLGDPDWPQDKLRTRIRQVRAQQAKVRATLAAPAVDLDRGRNILLATLDLLSQPQELYRLADQGGRKLLNKAIFNRLLLDEDDDGSHVSGDELNEPFQTVVTYNRRNPKPSTFGQTARLRSRPTEAPLVELLDAAISSRCSSKAKMVEVPGIEPGSFGGSTRLLRAQPATDFSASAAAQAPRCRPSHCLVSRLAP